MDLNLYGETKPTLFIRADQRTLQRICIVDTCARKFNFHPVSETKCIPGLEPPQNCSQHASLMHR